MKTVIVYSSVYGSTEKYAEWLSEELSCSAVTLKNATAETFNGADTVILGAPLFLGKLNDGKKLAALSPYLEGKKVLVFTVGITNPAKCDNREQTSEAARMLFRSDIARDIKFFPLRGDLNCGKLKFFHKTALRMLINGLKNEPASNDLETPHNLISRAAEAPLELIDRDSLKDIIEEAKNEK